MGLLINIIPDLKYISQQNIGYSQDPRVTNQVGGGILEFEHAAQAIVDCADPNKCLAKNILPSHSLPGRVCIPVQEWGRIVEGFVALGKSSEVEESSYKVGVVVL